jgi:ribonuclease J
LTHPNVRVLPLGGLGEIGKNMWAIETDDDLIVLDCGFAFPTEEMYGIDYVLPDYTYVVERQHKLRGIYISHGHEDHIGGLPYLLKLLDPISTVYATPLTASIIEAKLKEHATLRGKVPMQVVQPRDRLAAGNCTVEFVRVTHSIPDACAIAVHTPAGTVLYSGDFKMDQTPVDGQFFDFHRFAQMGEEGVLVLMSDSTNATREGFTPSERMVELGLDSSFATAKNRVIVATFASSVHRVQSICSLAMKYNRKVALIGRSLQKMAEHAKKHGFLTVPDGLILPIDKINTLPHEEVCIITTGSQGEPTSGLTRIAKHDHKHISVIAGDTIILSAIPIPGNERAVSRVINTLFQRGARVVYDTNRSNAPGALKHVSGHASREELGLMLVLTKPRYFIPIHGETRQLTKHGELAIATGVPPERVFILENGDIIAFDQERGKVVGQFNAEPVLVDGGRITGLGATVMRDRQKLGQEGVVSTVVTVDEDGYLVDGPELLSQGFLFAAELDAMADEAKEAVVGALERCRSEGKTASSALRSAISEDLGKFLYERVRRRPVILSMVQVARNGR